MQVLTDNTGFAWEINLDIDAYRRIKRECKIDMGMASHATASGLPLSVEIFESPLTLLDVLWAVCAPRAASKGVTRAAFDSQMFGPTLELAKSILFQEWIDFFRLLGRTHEAEALTNMLKMIPRSKEKAIADQLKELGEYSMSKSSPTPELPESVTPES